MVQWGAGNLCDGSGQPRVLHVRLAGQVERRHDLKVGRLGSMPVCIVAGVAVDESASGLINWNGKNSRLCSLMLKWIGYTIHAVGFYTGLCGWAGKDFWSRTL